MGSPEEKSRVAVEERVDKALEKTFGAMGQKPMQRPVGLGRRPANA